MKRVYILGAVATFLYGTLDGLNALKKIEEKEEDLEKADLVIYFGVIQILTLLASILWPLFWPLILLDRILEKKRKGKITLKIFGVNIDRTAQ